MSNAEEAIAKRVTQAKVWDPTNARHTESELVKYTLATQEDAHKGRTWAFGALSMRMCEGEVV